ncbi:MAG: hypothetical protein JW996_07245 [Candidatus Cloacimonetes bacterium]|nr:hypothetical protein [Candidatus Cloacimonadota bacterium]
MKKILFSVLLLSLMINLRAGRYAGDFMQIGSGVKALGLGGAFSAIADDGSAIYWNAAGISQIRGTDINLMRAFLYDGLAYYDNFSFCQGLPNEVTIGFNWTRLTIEEIPVFSEENIVGTNVDQRANDLDWILYEAGIPDDKFNSTDDLFQFAFAKHLHYQFNMGWLFYELPLDFYFGGNVKYIKRNIYDFFGTGTGFDLSFIAATDMSVLFDVDWLGKVRMGMNFQDIGGTVISWEDLESKHKDKILFNTKLGFALIQPLNFLDSELILSTDSDFVYETVNHYGIEFLYKDFLGVRGGYYSENISAGMSLKIYDFMLDYAFLTNVLGNTNRVGLRVNF